METRTIEKAPHSVDQVLEVARQQKRLIWLILLQTAFEILLFISYSAFTRPSEFAENLSGSDLVCLLAVVLGIFCAYLVYRIGRALEISTLWLAITMVLMFVPYIRLVVLLYMNSRATKFLRTALVTVGFMGAKTKSLTQMREFE